MTNHKAETTQLPQRQPPIGTPHEANVILCIHFPYLGPLAFLFHADGDCGLLARPRTEAHAAEWVPVPAAHAREVDKVVMHAACLQVLQKYDTHVTDTCCLQVLQRSDTQVTHAPAGTTNAFRLSSGSHT